MHCHSVLTASLRGSGLVLSPGQKTDAQRGRGCVCGTGVGPWAFRLIPTHCPVGTSRSLRAPTIKSVIRADCPSLSATSSCVCFLTVCFLTLAHLPQVCPEKHQSRGFHRLQGSCPDATAAPWALLSWELYVDSTTAGSSAALVPSHSGECGKGCSWFRQLIPMNTWRIICF